MSSHPPEIEERLKKQVYIGIVILGILFVSVIGGMTWKFFIPSLSEKSQEININPY
jgi:hypothetical protein